MAGLRVCMMVPYDIATHGGGVKQHAVQLADELRLMGDEVTIVGPASGPLTDPLHVGFGGVVNIPANGSDNYLGLLVSPWKVRRFFREHEFDVMHVHEPLQPALTYWSVWGTPDVPHVATFHAFSEDDGVALLPMRRVLGKRLLPHFQRGIAVSEPAARYARATWSRELAIIPNGVPIAAFSPRNEPLPLDDSRPVRLLFVGRLADRRKGIRYLIDAYAALVAQKLPVTLDVVGDLGDDAPPRALPGMTVHGSVPFTELVEHFRNCDVFVAPSTGQESFGIVLVEAMAAGRVVVCSDIEGYRQVASKDGCRLAPPSDAPGLARVLADVVRLPAAERRRMGEANLAHVGQFEWRVLAERVRTEYLAAIEAKRR